VNSFNPDDYVSEHRASAPVVNLVHPDYNASEQGPPGSVLGEENKKSKKDKKKKRDKKSKNKDKNMSKKKREFTEPRTTDVDVDLSERSIPVSGVNIVDDLRNGSTLGEDDGDACYFDLDEHMSEHNPPAPMVDSFNQDYYISEHSSPGSVLDEENERGKKDKKKKSKSKKKNKKKRESTEPRTTDPASDRVIV